MKELLVPVGSLESLRVAVHSGADAVYLGGVKFGARAFAHNLTNEEMVDAIKFCHLYGVKIYVTVNTMIYEDELDEVFDYVKFLHENGVDAIIMQDLGLIARTRKELPNLDIHVSTQMHNTNEDGIKLLEELGVTRVVLARELSLSDIREINTTLEKEVFIHGAICVSYSGQCLFSSKLMGRSGNRGTCAQICRLPFRLMCNDEFLDTEGSYLLSPKELNTANDFKDIMDSDIISLKIEGRMKSPEYVGCVTRLYRDLMDKYYRGDDVIPDKKLVDDLTIIFNRQYTNGFLFNATNHKLMNIKSSNHLGVNLGSVIKVDDKRVFIKLDRDIHQGDGIRFNEINEGMIVNYLYDKSDKLINHANKGDVVALDNKFNVKMGTVNKTYDVLIAKYYSDIPLKKIPVRMKFVAVQDQSMSLTISDGRHEYTVMGGMPEVAKSAPMTKERVYEQLGKLGSTPFMIEDMVITLDDNLFINIKDLNELRRSVTDELIKKMESNTRDFVVNDAISINKMKYDENIKLNVLVRTENQLKSAIDCNVDRIYVTSYRLYNKYKDLNNIYYRSLRNGVKLDAERVLATELGAIKRHNNCISDYYLNVANHETINLLSNYTDVVTLSSELDDIMLASIMKSCNNKANVEVVVHTNYELMITKYCPLNLLVNKEKICKVCLDSNKYYLVDRNDKKYRVLTDYETHLTHIMHYETTDMLDDVTYLINLGVNNLRIELLDEDYEQTKMLINAYKNRITSSF